LFRLPRHDRDALYDLPHDVQLQAHVRYHVLILSMPAIYTSGFGFTYYYGSQVRAMGKSGLANSWLGYDVPGLKTPVPALLCGALVGYAVGLRYQYLPTLKHEDLFSIALMGAMLTYFSQFISFVIFRWYYPTIKREFISPLGVYGAVYGLIVFGIIFVVLAGLEKSIALVAFGVYIGILLLYYYIVVVHRQVFSEEEKTVLFKAYLMKTNRKRAERVRRGQARQHAVDSTPRSKPTPTSASSSATSATGAAKKYAALPSSSEKESSGVQMQDKVLDELELGRSGRQQEDGVEETMRHPYQGHTLTKHALETTSSPSGGGESCHGENMCGGRGLDRATSGSDRSSIRTASLHCNAPTAATATTTAPEIAFVSNHTRVSIEEAEEVKAEIDQQRVQEGVQGLQETEITPSPPALPFASSGIREQMA